MDPYRLPQHVVPTRYDLRLEPDLAAGAFTGQETISLTVREATTEILLNASELDIGPVTIEGPELASQPGAVTLLDKTERCRITFAQAIQPGAWRLQLSFKGILNDKLRGFYRSRYKDSAGSYRFLAATQFEATDARRAFPCWDEPAFKAVFASTLVIDPALTALSNTNVASERIAAEKKVVRFADTIPMSTYLVAFIVGELEATEPVRVGEAPLRVWCVPGKSRLAAFGQEIGAFSLHFFEEYYQYPYPGDKLDLVAIPDFAAGAMENLGAITFRETALLVDHRAATHAELERVADVVAHENAHMWFGDLVTMRWWNGLWLNEAFATFMEMLAVDAWKPDWQRWTTFGVSRAAALQVDGLNSTRPIEYPVAAPHDADAMFDVLTYEKGASVLRMFEQYLGPEVFRAGVREYLHAHAHGNTETGDLWVALGHAAGQPMPEIMDGWVFRPGYPLISASLDADGRLLLTQQRFRYLLTSETNTPAPTETLWQVPLQVRIATEGTTSSRRVLLADAQIRLDLPARIDAVLVNEGGHGFYRVHYAPDLLERLLRRLPDGLAAIERFNLVNDAWAAALAGLMRITDYLELTARFRNERDKNVWAVLVGSFYLLNRILDAEDRPRLQALVRDRVGPAVAELGWAPRPGESDLEGQLRGDLLRTLGTLGDDLAVQSRAALHYSDSERSGDQRDANVLAAVIGILAHAGDSARYAEFLRRFKEASTPQEEQRFLYALAGFRQADLLEQTLMRTLNGEMRTQDAPYVLRTLLMNVSARELAWEFIKANWDKMSRDYPATALRRMCEGMTGLTTPHLEREVHDFCTARQLDLGGKTLQQYLEQLRIAVAFREREGEALRSYLKRQ